MNRSFFFFFKLQTWLNPNCILEDSLQILHIDMIQKSKMATTISEKCFKNLLLWNIENGTVGLWYVPFYPASLSFSPENYLFCNVYNTYILHFNIFFMWLSYQVYLFIPKSSQEMQKISCAMFLFHMTNKITILNWGNFCTAVSFVFNFYEHLL